MKTQKSISHYLKKDKGITPKTIRAEQDLWDQVKALADKYEVSQNELIVAALTKICEDELGK